MDEKLIENWNKKVKSKDETYILGDFVFGNGQRANEIFQKLNGKKYLIKGNHDHFLKDNSFDRSLIGWIKDYYMLKINGLKIVLFHYPVQTWDCKHHGSIHLYGHIHSNIGDHPMDYIIPNSYNVGVDVNNFEPISLEEVLIKLNYKTK